MKLKIYFLFFCHIPAKSWVYNMFKNIDQGIFFPWPYLQDFLFGGRSKFVSLSNFSSASNKLSSGSGNRPHTTASSNPACLHWKYAILYYTVLVSMKWQTLMGTNKRTKSNLCFWGGIGCGNEELFNYKKTQV